MSTFPRSVRVGEHHKRKWEVCKRDGLEFLAEGTVNAKAEILNCVAYLGKEK